MTTATFANIKCPTCTITATVPVDALLVSVAGDDLDTGLPHETGAPGCDGTAATVAWTCDTCADLTSIDIDWPALLTLVTAGVTLLDDASDDELPAHPEHPTAGAPLTRDDLLALHELLASEAWFDKVAPTGCMNP
ncbi:MAG: hypothetical protein ACRDWY_08140 [Actinomycetes bacterium]